MEWKLKMRMYAPPLEWEQELYERKVVNEIKLLYHHRLAAILTQHHVDKTT